MKGTDLETVNPQALEGVPDAMSVSNLTEASLLHTVRERYNRDEVSSYISCYHRRYNRRPVKFGLDILLVL